jgi:hypothetical protein
MAAPTAKVAAKVQGLREAKAKLLAIPEATRQAMAAAIEQTAAVTAHAAAQNVRLNRFGYLKRAIGYKFYPRTLRAVVGVSNQAYWVHLPNGRMIRIQPSRYDNLVEFGRAGRPMPTAPFMLPAAESQRQPYAQRVRAEMKKAERDLSVSRGGL